MPTFRRNLIFVMLGLAIALMPTPAHAHGSGGTLQMNIVPAGAYQISLWTEPTPLTVGNIHFNIAVTTPPTDTTLNEAGAPVLNADVTVTLTPVGDTGESRTLTATHEDAVSKIFYNADTDITTPGDWRITVTVSAAEGRGSADTIVTIAETSGQPSRWLWYGAGAAVALTAGLFLFRQSRPASSPEN